MPLSMLDDAGFGHMLADPLVIGNMAVSFCFSCRGLCCIKLCNFIAKVMKFGVIIVGKKCLYLKLNVSVRTTKTIV